MQVFKTLSFVPNNLHQLKLRCLYKIATKALSSFDHKHLSSSRDDGQVNDSSNNYATVSQHWKNGKEFAQELLSNIIYQDENMIAFNKPTGIPMHSQKYRENSIENVSEFNNQSIGAVKDLLMKSLNVTYLKEVFCQHRLYSGITLFALTQEAETSLSHYFRHTRANKVLISTYSALTLGIPAPSSGTEEMAIEQKQIGHWLLSVEAVKSVRRKRQDREMIISKLQYNVVKQCCLNDKTTLALVNISPTTSKWDSMQLQLVQRMSPILGDHLYGSRLTSVFNRPLLMNALKVEPKTQEIPAELSRLLNCKTSADIPLHLHCQQLIIPRLKHKHKLLKDTFIITAPLPNYFSKTLTTLGMTV